MKQSHRLLWVARNCDWSRKITPLPNLTQMVSRGMRTYSENKSKQILKKMRENQVIRAALGAEKLGGHLLSFE